MSPEPGSEFRNRPRCPLMDRIVAFALFTLALAFGCIAVLLALSGLIDYLVHGHWPDHSVLQLAYDNHLLRARWFLAHDWSMPLHDLLGRVPAALPVAALAPTCWWLGDRLARR